MLGDSPSRSTSSVFGRPIASHFVLFAYLILVLLPLFNSGYYSDDLETANIRGQLALNHQTLAQYVLNENQRLITESGRVQPFAHLIYFVVPYVFADLHSYKAFIAGMIFLNVTLFGTLVHRLLGDRYASYLAMLLVPILFQFRLYHDPILSMSAMIPTVVFLVFATLILLDSHLVHRSTSSLVGSLVCFNLSLYTYEVILFLIPICFLVIANRRGVWTRDTWRAFLPYGVFAIVWVVVCAVAILRLGRPPVYDGVAANFAARAVAKTFLLQVYAALPGSYFLGNPSNVFARSTHVLIRNVTWLDLVPVAFVIFLASALIGKLARVKSVAVLVWSGLLMFSMPAAMISLSGKYQRDLQFHGLGMGYVPVYIQYFGTVLLIIAVMSILATRLSGPKQRLSLQAACALLFSFVLLVNLQSNRIVVDEANLKLHYRRAGLARALSEHILDSVPDGARILILDEYGLDGNSRVKSHLDGWARGAYRWKSEAFVYQNANRRIAILDDPRKLLDPSAPGRSEPPETDLLYLLVVKSYPSALRIRDAYVVLASITDVRRDQSGAVKFQSIPVGYNFPAAAVPMDGDQRFLEWNPEWDRTPRIK